MVMTNKEFCDKLRDAAISLAEGSHEEIVMPLSFIELNLDEESAKSVNSSYIRTVIGRVPQVRAIGSPSVKKKTTEDGIEIYQIAINRNPKRRVIVNDDLPVIKRDAVKKFAERIMMIAPDLSHLDGESLEVANKAVAAYKALIRDFMED